MNKIFNLIWSKTKEKWIVVSEKVKGNGKVPTSQLLSIAVLTALFSSTGVAYGIDSTALPTGGQITSGTGAINTSGTRMTIDQTSQKMIANWVSFNIGENASVRFNQPGIDAAVLNRIADRNPSQIMGSLASNGQVFLINSSGIIFGKNAAVNVGGLVASSLNLPDSDFLAGNYRFSSNGSAGAILNQGAIKALDGGVVALMAPIVINDGSITANSGSSLLAAGNKVTLDFTGDGLINFTVDQGAVDALVENKGLIKADGGVVVMTTRAADALRMATTTNSGVIEAHTLKNKAGRMLLLSDMDNGQTLVSGTLDASAPDGGNGGFIEASGSQVKITDSAHITTVASTGQNGTFLLDPNNFTIAAVGGNITGAALGNLLNSNSVTIQTVTGTDSATNLYTSTSGNGDILVNDAVTKTSGSATTLTLAADRDIKVSQNISASLGSPLNLVLAARAGGGATGAVTITKIIKTYGGNVTIGGGDSNASGYAVANPTDGWHPSGVNISDGVFGGLVDASGDGGATFNSNVLTGSSSATGGDIVIRGKGNTSNNSCNWGVWIKFGSVTTAGNGTINITGYGGNGSNVASVGSVGVLLESYAQIIAKDGNIVINGYAGNGGDAYGVASTESDKMIKTAGSLSLGGSSLLIRNGILTIDIGKNSDITAPIVGINGQNSGPYELKKSGIGTLNLSGNAEFWNNNRPANTSQTTINGTFTDASSKVNVVNVTADQALYAFSTRPETITPVTSATGIYLRLIPGSSYYGDTPIFTYGYYDASAGGNAVNDASPSGTVIWSNPLSATSIAATYSETYSGGITLGNASYTLSAGSGVNWVINPRPLTITGVSTSRYYGSVNPTVTAFTASTGSDGSHSGLVNSDAITSVTNTIASTATATANAGTTHDITPGSAIFGSGMLDNYAITYAPGTLTIGKAHLTVTADPQSRLYGASNPVFTETITGFVNEETAAGVVTGTATGSSTAKETTGVGTAIITGSVAGLSASNYDFSAVDGVLTVTPDTRERQLLSEPVPPTRSSYQGNPTASEPSLISPDQRLRVAVVNLPVGTASGLVVVTVPQGLVDQGSVIKFDLPEQAKNAASSGGVTTITMLDGSPLPSWLNYNAEAKMFTATNIPQGMTELKVFIVVGGQGWEVDVSVQPAS